MPAPPTDAYLAASVLLTIDGSKPSVDALRSVEEVQVLDDLNTPSSFFLTLNNLDDAGSSRWSDDDLFRAGKSVTVQLGYHDDVEEVIEGEITGLEFRMAAGEGGTLIVRGYNRGHRLLRNLQTTTYTSLKDSDIAQQIADRLGLDTDIEATREMLAYVMQSNLSDLDFLKQRAARIGYEVFVRKSTLHFRSSQHTASPTVHLHSATDLLEFDASASAVQQRSKVQVRGWSPSNKRVLTSTAAADTESSNMAGDQLGVKNAESAFGASTRTLVDSPVFTQAEADSLASTLFRQNSLEYVVAEGLCLGRTDIRAGMVIALDGLGKRFSGNYYVIGVKHTYSREGSFLTRWTGRRNAS